MITYITKYEYDFHVEVKEKADEQITLPSNSNFLGEAPLSIYLKMQFVQQFEGINECVEYRWG